MAGTLESRVADRIGAFQRARADPGRPTDDEVEFLLDAMPFIKEYASPQAVDADAPTLVPAGPLANFVNVTHKNNRNNVLQRYLMHVEKQVDPTTMAAAAAHEDATAKHHPCEAEYFCSQCDAGMDFHQRESMLVCPRCGACRAFTEMSANNLTYEQEIHQDVVTYFAYKRLNHFCEWLNSLQAKVRFISWRTGMQTRTAKVVAALVLTAVLGLMAYAMYRVITQWRARRAAAAAPPAKAPVKAVAVAVEAAQAARPVKTEAPPPSPAGPSPSMAGVHMNFSYLL